jgi:phytoene dehydrogenase-like protein
VTSPDAIVIGAGPNGLSAANVLAEAGWDVLVVEAQPEPGGAVRSAQVIEPGFEHDLFSAFYPLGVGSPVLRGFELERYGLRWRRSPLAVAHPRLDGSCAAISLDLEETVASVAGFSPADGDAWRRMYAGWERLGEAFIGALFDLFPPVRSGLRLLARLPKAEVLEFMRFATLPVRRYAEEQFSGDGARRLLGSNALHADLAPEAPASAVYGWVLCCCAQQLGFPAPEGGAGRLTGALVRRLEAHRGGVRCGAAAERILVRRGRAVGVRLAGGEEIGARRAVLADVGAPQLLLELLGEEHLPARVRRGIRRFEYDNGTVKVDWTLDAPIPWTAPDVRRAGTVHVAEGMDGLTRHAAQLAAHQLPDQPYLVVGQYAHFDPTRAPAGRDTAWAYTHVPQDIRGDAAGELRGVWDQAETDRFVERIEDRIEALAPGFRDRIRGRHVLTPNTLQRRNANLVNGALNGGTAQIHQQLIFRPVPGLARPETPVRNVYLASASAHPGGGVHGACGANAARAALSAQRRRRAVAAMGAAAVIGAARRAA